jgi:outer membrane biosynthesis protein TonB
MSRLVSRVLPAAALASLLAACSSMPEWTKPSTWYDGVTETKEQKAETKPAETAEVTKTAAPAEGGLAPVVDPLDPESDKKKPVIQPSEKPTEFPNLASQPAARQPATTEAQRREIRDSLVADRDNAQHSADELRGGTVPAAAPPAPAAAAAGTDKKAAEDKPKDE